MSMLKGNYKLDKEVTSSEKKEEKKEINPLEQEYYKAAMSKLGGSIAFIMKDKTFLWTGDAKSKPSSASSETPTSSSATEEKK